MQTYGTHSHRHILIQINKKILKIFKMCISFSSDWGLNRCHRSINCGRTGWVCKEGSLPGAVITVAVPTLAFSRSAFKHGSTQELSRELWDFQLWQELLRHPAFWSEQLLYSLPSGMDHHCWTTQPYSLRQPSKSFYFLGSLLLVNVTHFSIYILLCQINYGWELI